MELINRYLQAVRFWLPKAHRDDIVAELSEDIRSQAQERERELGRKLDDAEVAVLLKRMGPPLKVASRYLPQRHLIGPVLFPIYVFVLKIVVVLCLAPQVLGWLAAAAVGSGLGADTGTSLRHSLGAFCLSVFCSIGIVTFVFAVIERTKPGAMLGEEWSPLKLPAMRDPQRIPRSSSIFELVFWPVFLAWGSANLGLRTVFEVWGTRITVAPSWRYFFCGFMLLALAQVALSATNLFRPRWTRGRALVRLVLDCAGAVLLCALLKAGVVLDIFVATVPRAATLRVAGMLNHGALNAFVFSVVVSALIVAADLWRVFRVGADPGDATALGQV